MKHNLPSVKTLKTITAERASELRSVLEIDSWDELEKTAEKYPAVTDRLLPFSLHRKEFQHAKLTIADEILNTYGVEYISAGKGRKSPAVEYCNTGDSYKPTLMYVSGKGYRVGCWADIVERGNYE